MKTDRPITRKEQYLAKAAGVISGDTPPAVTKEEQYLKKIADSITDLTKNPLPEVSSEDEGKVPVVGSDGKWELGEGGGGSSESFVVFDGDIVFEEYDDDGDIYGRTVNPPEIDAISDTKLKQIAKCPLLYDYAEIDGIKLTHTTHGNMVWDAEQEGWVSIAKQDDSDYDGVAHVYLEFFADTPGTHRVKIYASYGGAAHVGSNFGSGASQLYMDYLDAYVASRCLYKPIIVTTGTLSSNGTATVYAPVSYYVDEGADVNEDDFYFVNVAGTPFFAPENRFFFTNWHFDTHSVNMYIYHMQDGTPEWLATFKPDEFIAATNTGLYVNVLHAYVDEDGASHVHLNYTLKYDDDNELWEITLWGTEADSSTSITISGVTTNSHYAQSNEWFIGDPSLPK